MVTLVCAGCFTDFNVFPCYSHYRFCSMKCKSNFDARWMPEPNSGCWLWLWSVNPSGYALFRQSKGTILAHRISYERQRGPIPDGMQLDHLCRVRCCVNPTHLEVVTNQENARRGIRRTEATSRTTCVNGHLWVPKDTRTTRRGQRVCRVCERLNGPLKRLKEKAKKERAHGRHA